MFETLERLILLQIGAAAATRDRVQESVNRLIEQGRVEREEGRTMVEDILSRARERSAGARALVDTSMQRGLRATGFSNREAYEDLFFRVEQLEHRVRLLEGRPDAQTRPETPLEPPAPTAGEPTPPTTTPPVGGVDLAPQPPADEPETPHRPGLQPGRG
jgi:polyhydroxyalkanoate synthesis regulator phasin